LIELLVVIGIMLVIATVGYFLLPGLIGNQQRSRALDQLTEWLLTAKVRPRRDGLATGVRILADPTTNLATQVAFVQQPDPLTGGSCDGTYMDSAGTNPLFAATSGAITNATAANPIQITSASHGMSSGQSITINGVGGNTAANNTSANPTWTITVVDANNFTLNGSNAAGGTAYTSGGTWTLSSSIFVRFSGVDFLGPAAASVPIDMSQALVQPGDYLEINFSGNPHLITGVPTAANANGSFTLTIASPIPFFGSLSPGAAPMKPYPNTYRILRQPRLLVGEELKSLGAELAIDLNAGKSLNVPMRTVAGTPTTFSEIVFSPSGSVMGQGTAAGKIVLWVSDQSVGTTPAPPALVAINSRNGFIGAYEVAPGADPYLFTEDGRNGGF